MKHSHVATFHEYGGELHLEPDTDLHVPGPDEVTVEVIAAALNHMDYYVRQGLFKDSIEVDLPAHSGTCFSGYVMAVGENVKGLKHGDKVLGHDPHHAAHANYVTVPAGCLVRKPERTSWEEAAGLYMAGVVALATIESLALTDADTVVITAPAGGVGHLEVQLAKLAGATVIAVSGSENHDYLRSIGAKPVDYAHDLPQQIRKLAPAGSTISFIDNYGGYEQLMAQLNVPRDLQRTTEDRKHQELRFYQANGHDAEARTLLADITELVNSWQVRVLVSGFYPLEYISEAFGELIDRHSRGKIIVGMHTAAVPRNYLGKRTRQVYKDQQAAHA
jgi:NADPH2:quinone reductase